MIAPYWLITIVYTIIPIMNRRAMALWDEPLPSSVLEDTAIPCQCLDAPVVCGFSLRREEAAWNAFAVIAVMGDACAADPVAGTVACAGTWPCVVAAHRIPPNGDDDTQRSGIRQQKAIP